MNLDIDFWTKKYEQQQTGWDIGYASPPIASYFDQIEDKNLKILIPGCGNAYEAAHLFNKGFKNIYILDFVKDTLDLFKKTHPDFPEEQIILNDFFKVKDQFDIIIEQTFFCALAPTQRKEYVTKMKSLLKEGGKLIGVLFSRTFEKKGPPFGGTKQEYISLFSNHFEIKTLENCYNSILPRKGNELFFIFET
ncbi:methyltransferase domain-containing protein [Aquimarina litoralis]|uniref:methyltransferase domain-containing protein n=1 Tax=Aquimarina litoralis TaxID=584605 RepID=UPI001C58A7A8|nr:methyltransferase domain-containing protein [Aquimarina litoralis]MBW1294562.1 methyltransferase domain-containing protein [Aquimarina litoralis]